jgi:hypothetical protein
VRLNISPRPVDAWSLGILLYWMATGKIPCEAMSTQALYRRICRATFHLPSYLSKDIQGFLRAILTVDVSEVHGNEQPIDISRGRKCSASNQNMEQSNHIERDIVSKLVYIYIYIYIYIARNRYID